MPKYTPGANYPYMYNLHTMCKSAHVNGVYDKFDNIMESLGENCFKNNST